MGERSITPRRRDARQGGRATPSDHAIVPWLGLATAACALALVGGAGFGSALVPVAGAPLWASAGATGYTWFGIGNPCLPGSQLTYVAHFTGNASGGVAPYLFHWQFGDFGNGSTLGTTNSSVQNPNVTLSSFEPVIANLTVTDQAGSHAYSNVSVYPPSFNCPSEPPPPNPYFLPTAPEWLVYALPFAAAVLVAASVGVLWRIRGLR